MLLSQFTLDHQTGILVPPGSGAPAGYLDGAEQHLLAVLTEARDRSVASEELQRQIHDWPSQYHLTPYRSTIFDCFGFSAGDARVLELGAGCGAITRWLGEHCGEVHAIEGSLHRARVARARCAELEHVAVYSANYSQLAEQDAFDVVTLIGVLEYSHLYHPVHQNDPVGAALDNLRIARRALRRDGLLVLAIENRLGLKYLNGAREDHSGKQFEGVQGYPHATSAVTFSAHELRGMLAGAGFGDVGVYLPYPDYKLATTIVNAKHAGPDSGVHNWLPATAPDRGTARTAALFHESLAQRELGRAGLLAELANSFLILAYAGERDRSDVRHGLQTAWRARHYALGRRRGMQKRVTIGPPGDDVVRNEPVLGQASSGGAGALAQRLVDETMQAGELLVFDVHDAIAGTGFGEPFLSLLARHRDWLVQEFATGWVDQTGIPLLDGESFDAAWWNIVRATDGHWQRIDREWRFRMPIPLDYVVWRTLFHYALRFGLHLPQPWHGTDPSGFAEHWLRHLQPELDANRIAHLHVLERMVNQSVDARGGPSPAWPPTGVRCVCVAGSVDELSADRELLAGYVSAFGPDDAVMLTLYVERDRAGAQINRLRGALDELGVADDQLPELLVGLAHDPMSSRRAVSAAAVVLTRDDASDDDDDGVPRVADADELRRLVEERWAEAGGEPRWMWPRRGRDDEFNMEPLGCPWYHDFAPLGRPTIQAEGIFGPNQAAKQNTLFYYIRRAIELCPEGRHRPTGVELFCADGFYSHYALQHGARHMTGVDLGEPQSAGDPIHLRQAQAMTSLLGHSGRADFRRQDVHDVTGDYDFAICAGGLYHLSDPGLLLRHIHTHTHGPLILQTVYSLADRSPAYFQAPAPGWTWGCRFSVAYLMSMLRDSGWKVLDATNNELEGNTRPQDRGSIYALCVPVRSSHAVSGLVA